MRDLRAETSRPVTGRPGGTASTVTCRGCGRTVTVKPGGNPDHVDRARVDLTGLCQAAGCPCDPEFTPGLDVTPRTGSHRGGKHVRSRR